MVPLGTFPPLLTFAPASRVTTPTGPAAEQVVSLPADRQRWKGLNGTI